MLIQRFNLYKAEWLDLVFDNRNKNYGAYELRAHYAQTMLRAISITVFGVVTLALTFSVITKRPQLPVTTMHTTVVDLTKVMQPPPVKPIKQTAQPQAAPQTHINTVVIPTRVTTDPIKATEPPTLTELNQSAIGTESHKGDAPGINSPINISGTDGSGGAIESKVDDTVYPIADTSPEPNGGMAGWSKFLQSHLRYPDTEVQGRVLISFVVEKDGSLTDIKLVRGADSKLDAEALRVLKIAPRWKPGLQGGKPVRAQYTIPINFQLNN